MRKLIALLVLAGTVLVPARASATTTHPNVVILMSDDQRFDMVTPTFTPRIYNKLVAGNPSAFTNAFVPNPLCCPSRTSILTGDYSHTTGVWYNGGPYGGFHAFDDKHTMAVDFQQQGYRTAMIGKYLNGYRGGKDPYVPPGWDRWFATNTGAYYDYGVTATGGKLLHYGSRPFKDYITNVLEQQAETFVGHAVAANAPFFLYYAFTAPHRPSIPSPQDVGRFSWVTPADTGTPTVREQMLESAYGVDRAAGKLLAVLPSNTIVVYLSDNGLLWGEREGTWGPLVGKQWPYDPSTRIPMIYATLDPSLPQPLAGTDDIVLNVDLRTSLTHAAGIAPLTTTEGINWFRPTYTSRTRFLIEHYQELGTREPSHVPSYCGIREIDPAKGNDLLYVRFQFLNGDGTSTYREELYAEPDELTNLASTDATDLARLHTTAESLCDTGPPGYSWSP